MPMKCPSCGKETEGNFCNYCGTPLPKEKMEEKLTVQKDNDFMKYFGEDESAIKGECPGCGRVLKIQKQYTSESSVGYDIKPPVSCMCGKEYGVIIGKKTSTMQNQEGNDKKEQQLKEKPFYETGWFYAVIILLFLLTKTSYGKSLLHGLNHKNTSQPVQQVQQTPTVQPQAQLDQSTKQQNPDIANKSSEFPIQIIDHTLVGRDLKGTIKNISNETIEGVFIEINFYDINGVQIDDQNKWVFNIEGNGLANFEVNVKPSVDFPYSYKFMKITTNSSRGTQVNNNPVTVIQKSKPYTGHWISANYAEQGSLSNGKTIISKIPINTFEVYLSSTEDTIIVKQGDQVIKRSYTTNVLPKAPSKININIEQQLSLLYDINEKTLIQLNETGTYDAGTFRVTKVVFKYVDEQEEP